MKKWKKLLAGLLMTGLLSATPAAASAAEEITVSVNGQEIAFDQPPVVQNGRTLVPMRAILEALGAEIVWNGAEKRVDAFWGINSLSLWLASCEIQMSDGSLVTIDVPAQAVNGRTLVPLRAVSQCMGAEVLWDGETKTIQINRDTMQDYYQNDLYEFTFDVPEGFRFMEEYTDGSGAWFAHVTEPVSVAVTAEAISASEGKCIAALQEHYLQQGGDLITYSMIRNEYSMEMLWDDGNTMEFSYVHLHHGVETVVRITIPNVLYDQYETGLDAIHACLAFG